MVDGEPGIKSNFLIVKYAYKNDNMLLSLESIEKAIEISPKPLNLKTQTIILKQTTQKATGQNLTIYLLLSRDTFKIYFFATKNNDWHFFLINPFYKEHLLP